jgi:NADH-quinone oxidoreductase subunit N
MILLLSRAGYEAENSRISRASTSAARGSPAMMLMMMFSMAGIPVLRRLLRQVLGPAGGGRRRLHLWLAVVAVMFSLVGAFYYLRVASDVLQVDSAPMSTSTALPWPASASFPTR